MTGQKAIAEAVAALSARDIPEPARDARRLLAHVLGIDAGRLTLILPDPLTPAQLDRFEALIDRRGRREPVAHLTGERAFFGRVFEVGPDVLDPRPETETLVAAALARPWTRVLDLGTGSGCILATLLAERGPGHFGIGTDISAAALAVAGRNVARTRVEDLCQLHQGAWFDALPKGTVAFDLIVSNPPYIAADDMPGLAEEVRAFEPRLALTDEGDGLGAYRSICANACRHLVSGGALLVEIGPTQAKPVSELMAFGGLEDPQVLPDLDGRDRVVWARRR